MPRRAGHSGPEFNADFRGPEFNDISRRRTADFAGVFGISTADLSLNYGGEVGFPGSCIARRRSLIPRDSSGFVRFLPLVGNRQRCRIVGDVKDKSMTSCEGACHRPPAPRSVFLSRWCTHDYANCHHISARGNRRSKSEYSVLSFQSGNPSRRPLPTRLSRRCQFAFRGVTFCTLGTEYCFPCDSAADLRPAKARQMASSVQQAPET